MSGGSDSMWWDILGIEQTTDIKKIKRAYAAAAKKNNPEEFPEQFRKIHDAYKQALKYASDKSDKNEAFIVSSDTVDDVVYIDITELGITPGNVEELYTYYPRKETENGSSIPVEETFYKESSKANEEKYDFDFDDVDVIRNRNIHLKNPQERDKFVKKLVLSKLKELADDHDVASSYTVWKTFLSDSDVCKVLSDKANHMVIDPILERKRFTLHVASLFCSTIGGKCKIVYNPEFDIYYVDVTGKRKLYYYVNSIRKRKLSKIGWFVAVLLLLLAIALSPE